MKLLRSRALHWLLALPVSGLLLYLSLRGVAWAQVGRLLSTVRPFWLALAWTLAATAILFRAIRWRVLLRAEGDVSVSTVFFATAAGYFGNNFLPARAGELVRAFMVSSATGLSRTYALTTGISERVADAVALIAISAAVIVSGEFHPPWLGRAAAPFTAAAACGILALALLPLMEGGARRLLRRLPLPARIASAGEQMMAQIVMGVRSLRNPSRLSRFVILTALIWFVDATGSVMAGRALGVPMTLPAAFLLIAALGLSSAVPSTPGYVGVYQFVAVAVLTPFGFSRAQAVGYIIFVQAMQYLLVALLGGAGFWRYRKLRHPAATDPGPAALPGVPQASGAA